MAQGEDQRHQTHRQVGGEVEQGERHERRQCKWREGIAARSWCIAIVTRSAIIQNNAGNPSSAIICSGSQWEKRKWVASSARRPMDPVRSSQAILAG